jgi:hypothetical protein
MVAYLLLQDRSDVGVGGIHCQGEDGPGQGVSQGHRSYQDCFGGSESGVLVRQPGEYLGVTCKCGGERLDGLSGPRNGGRS